MAVCVSIFMLTYNQEDYIAQAIEGVMMQKTSFIYQLVIGEDYSTDRTREICKQYAAKFPGKIKLLLNDRNFGLGANYVKTYSECKGKYVAICDGDDYWIDPFKLQKQVDFLEQNKEFSLVYTLHKSLYPSGKINTSGNDNISLNDFDDLVKGNFIASVTSLFRNEKLSKNLKNFIPTFPYGDWPTYLLVLRNGGKIKLLPEVTAVYRKDFGTLSKLRKKRTSLGEINLAILKVLLKDTYFIERRESLWGAVLLLKKGLIASYFKEKRYFQSFKMAFEIFKREPVKIISLYLYLIKRVILK